MPPQSCLASHCTSTASKPPTCTMQKSTRGVQPQRAGSPRSLKPQTLSPFFGLGVRHGTLAPHGAVAVSLLTQGGGDHTEGISPPQTSLSKSAPQEPPYPQSPEPLGMSRWGLGWGARWPCTLQLPTLSWWLAWLCLHTTPLKRCRPSIPPKLRTSQVPIHPSQPESCFGVCTLHPRVSAWGFGVMGEAEHAMVCGFWACP